MAGAGTTANRTVCDSSERDSATGCAAGVAVQPCGMSSVTTASAAEGDAQAAAYAAVDARVDSESAVIPWSYASGWWLVRPGLRGLGTPAVGLLDFGRVSWDR